MQTPEPPLIEGMTRSLQRHVANTLLPPIPKLALQHKAVGSGVARLQWLLISSHAERPDGTGFARRLAQHLRCQIDH